MVNKKWLISAGILAGLMVGASSVQADTTTNVANGVTSSAVAANTTATGEEEQSSAGTQNAVVNNQSQEQTNSATTNNDQQAATSQEDSIATNQDNITVTSPKADYYNSNQWHYDKYTNEWTYSKSDGTRADNEWLWINGAWYYFDGSVMAANGWHSGYWNSDWRTYYFDANGHYETNQWHYDKYTKEWTYSKSDGTRADNEWLWINGAWYYFDGSVMAANGWHSGYWNSDWRTYYFDANGHYVY
jgi:glucan-binding YG repeat protein